MTRTRTTYLSSSFSLRLAAFLVPVAIGSALSIPAVSCGGSSGPGGTGGTTSTGGASTGGATATGGSLSTGGTNTGGIAATGGIKGTGGNGTGGSSTGGASAGGASTGGATATGGGNGGTVSGGRGGAGPIAGSGGGNSTGGSGGGSSGNGDCPAGALFCSGFEDSGLPSGATYFSSNAQNDVQVAIDKTKHKSGSQSLKVNPVSGFSDRTLSVPAKQAFWFRAYMQTDKAIDMTSASHESFMGAFVGMMNKGVEIVQEQCQVAVNIDDNPVFGSNGMSPPGSCSSSGTKLEANKWYCFEGSFDGSAGNFEIFLDGKSIIKATNVSKAKQQFSAFRFGYTEYNGTSRTTWYDDVTVATQRIGCLP